MSVNACVHSPPARSGLMRKCVTVALAVSTGLLLVGALLNLRYFVVSGASMSPTLESGQRILVERLLYRFRDPRPDEVVVVNLRPEDAFFANIGGGQYVKRIVAGPGDTIQITQGVVFVNGSPLPEPYVQTLTKQDMAPVTVAPNSYFFLGDNRNQTEDSRSWGPLPQDRIKGRVWLSLPF